MPRPPPRGRQPGERRHGQRLRVGCSPETSSLSSQYSVCERWLNTPRTTPPAMQPASVHSPSWPRIQRAATTGMAAPGCVLRWSRRPATRTAAGGRAGSVSGSATRGPRSWSTLTEDARTRSQKPRDPDRDAQADADEATSARCRRVVDQQTEDQARDDGSDEQPAEAGEVATPNVGSRCPSAIQSGRFHRCVRRGAEQRRRTLHGAPARLENYHRARCRIGAVRRTPDLGSGHEACGRHVSGGRFWSAAGAAVLVKNSTSSGGLAKRGPP